MSYDDYRHYRAAYNPPSKPKRPWWVWPIGLVLLLCVGGTVIAAVSNSSDGKTAGPVASTAVDIANGAVSRASAKAKPPAKAPAKAATVGAGSWEVGTEVEPGTYTATATDHCYWARLKAFDGDFDSIITNGNLDAGQRGRITVKKSDKGLELSGDCTWKLAGAK